MKASHFGGVNAVRGDGTRDGTRQERPRMAVCGDERRAAIALQFWTTLTFAKHTV
jgi:hypothetical protein